jgi:hypothetical protein
MDIKPRKTELSWMLLYYTKEQRHFVAEEYNYM